MPTFNLAFKCEPLTHGDAAIREEMVADLAAEALFGESSGRKALAAFHAVEEQKKNRYAEYRIGKLYAAGLGCEQDYGEAARSG